MLLLIQIVNTSSLPLKQPSPAVSVEEAPPTKKPTRLAIGVEGGFDGGLEKVEFEETYSLVVMPPMVIIVLPNDQLSQKVLLIDGIWWVEKDGVFVVFRFKTLSLVF